MLAASSIASPGWRTRPRLMTIKKITLLKIYRTLLAPRRFLACAALALPLFGQAAELNRYVFQDTGYSVCKIDLDKDAVRMYWKDDRGQEFRRLNQLKLWLRQRGEELVCATNAGIYDTDLRPRGLYIEDGLVKRQLNERKNAYGNFYIQPNGALLLSERRATIIDTDQLSRHRDTLLAGVSFATQSGPILIYHGQINPLFMPDSENRVIRNAACTGPGNTLSLVVSRDVVSFYMFARFLREKLACNDALYLDGSVSRMYPGDVFEVGPDFGAMIGVTKKSP